MTLYTQAAVNLPPPQPTPEPCNCHDCPVKRKAAGCGYQAAMRGNPGVTCKAPAHRRKRDDL